MSWWIATIVAGLVSRPIDTVSVIWRREAFIALVRGANPEVVMARERRAAAEARIGPARLPEDPFLEVGSMNRTLLGLGRSSPVAMDQIRLIQALPLSGRLGAGRDAARARMLEAANAERDVERRLRWQVTTAFVEIDRIDRTLALLATFRPVLIQLEAVARARYASGLASQAELLRAQLEAARLGEEEIAARAGREAPLAQLNALALRPNNATIGGVVLPIGAVLPPRTRLIESLDGHPMIASSKAAQAASGFDRKQAEAARWPDLEIGLSYGQQPMPDGSGTERMVSLTLGTRVPLWAGTKQGGRRREAVAMERMAAAELASRKADLTARVSTLLGGIEKAARLTDLYQLTLAPQSRAAAASSLASYRNGTTDFDVVGTAQLAVLRVELDLLRFAAERAMALAELEYLTGFGFTGDEGEGL